MYAQWIESYRDLPILINQWANVVRWEKATRPFLRTMEFLWQEGHTAHATAAEAREETLKILELYRDFAENVAAVPVYSGRKSASERFPGAVETYCDRGADARRQGAAIGDVARLGQNFAKAYDIKFVDADQRIKHVYTTSWGVSWRMLGGLIMVHGDDRGLRIPPKMAPIEAVFVPIVRSGDERAVERCTTLAQDLDATRAFAFASTRATQQPGWKYQRVGSARRAGANRDRPARRRCANCRAGATRPQSRRAGSARERRPRGRGSRTCASCSTISSARLYDRRRRSCNDTPSRRRIASEFLELCRSRAGMIDIPWCERPGVRGARQSGNDCDDARPASARSERDCLYRVRRAGQSQSVLCAILLNWRSPRTAFAIASSVAAASAPSVADLDAAARAVGNRRDLAERIGVSVFATPWPAEVSQISANAVEGHSIVGIRIWGVKFHTPMTREQFVDEVVTHCRTSVCGRPGNRRGRRVGEHPDCHSERRDRERRSGEADHADGL